MKPLSAVAKRALYELRDGPMPRQEFNPGTVDRLLRGGLVEMIDLPSPYPSHKHRPICHLQITARGLAEIKDTEPRDDFARGFYCAVAQLLRYEGCVSGHVRSLFSLGGDPLHADPIDVDLFRQHGLLPSE